MAPTSRFVALLRGINVGGHHRVGMTDLADCFRAAGYGDVRTYIQSGNVVFAGDPATAPEREDALERVLEERFAFPIPVVVRSREELAAIVAAAPAGHGSDDLRSDVFFLKHPLTAEEAFAQLPELRDGVDSAAMGPGVLYFSRLKARAGDPHHLVHEQGGVPSDDGAQLAHDHDAARHARRARRLTRCARRIPSTSSGNARVSP